jgi:hypothetical protein
MSDARRLDADLASLSRGDLEEIVRQSVRDGKPVARAAIVPSSPTPAARSAPTAVAAALADADVGLFRWLDDDVMAEVLGQLAAVARLAFTQRVCKSLRELGARLPWKRIVLDERCEWRKRPDEVLWIVPGADFARIRAFVCASAPVLTTLSLTLKDAPRDVDEIAKLVCALPKLTDLTLAGKKMSSQVTKPLIAGKAGWLAAPVPRALKRLTLGYAAGTSETTFRFLCAANRLEHLSIHNSLKISALMDVFLAWRKSRGGRHVQPLLESLELGTDQTDDLPLLCLNGYPGLRHLKLRMWCDKVRGDLSLPKGLRTFEASLIGITNKDNDSVWSLSKQYQKQNNPALVRSLLAACPCATSVTIGWQLNTKATEKQIAGSLPLGHALEEAPVTLEHLTLVGMRIVEESLEPLYTRAALRTLTLRQCVIDAPVARKALRARGVAVSVSSSTA